MLNKNIVPIGILIAAVFIIVGMFLILNPSHSGGGNIEIPNGNESYIEQTESTVSSMPEYKVTEENLNLNANVPLKPGKKYEYKTTTQMTFQTLMCNGQITRNLNQMSPNQEPNGNQNQGNLTEQLPEGCVYVNRTSTQIMDTEFYVGEKTEKVENKDCYVVSISTKREISNEERNMTSRLSPQQQQRLQNLSQQQNTFYYYDKETGKIMKVITKTGNTELTFTGDLANAMLNMGRTFTRNLMNATQINATRNRNMGGMSLDIPVFSQWMLALNENFMWSQIVDEQTGGYKVEMTYKVIGAEKINNMDCFKVEITLSENNKINAKWIVWVSKEKRILVKMQRITGDIISAETNLISEM